MIHGRFSPLFHSCVYTERKTKNIKQGRPGNEGIMSIWALKKGRTSGEGPVVNQTQNLLNTYSTIKNRTLHGGKAWERTVADQKLDSWKAWELGGNQNLKAQAVCMWIRLVTVTKIKLLKIIIIGEFVSFIFRSHSLDSTSRADYQPPASDKRPAPLKHHPPDNIDRIGTDVNAQLLVKD